MTVTSTSLLHPPLTVRVVVLGFPLALALVVISLGWRAGNVEAQGGDSSDPDEVIRTYDTIYLTGDRVIEGTVLTEGELESLESLEVKLKPRSASGGSAVARLRRSEIVRVVRRRSPSEVYATKVAKVQRELDPRARAMAEAELADWCGTRVAVLGGAAPNPDAALRHYLAAVELDPTIHRVYPQILAILSDQGPLESADEARLETELLLYDLAARGGYENPELDYRRGLILAVRLNDPERALPHLEKVLRSEYANRGHLRRARSLVARAYADRGDLEKARAVYQPLLSNAAEGPTAFEAHFELARLAMAEDSPDSRAAAREHLIKAQELQPEYWPLLGYLAALEFAASDPAAATKLLRTYLEHEPDDFDAAADLALLETLGGNTVASERRLRELLTGGDDRQRARIHLLLGQILESRGDLPGALSEYRRAYEANAEAAAVRIVLGSALVRSRQPDEARQVLRSLLTERGESRSVFVACSRLLAEAELAEGKEHEARIHLQRAMELAPDDVLLRERLGILLMRLGRHDEGFRHLEAVRRAGPERPGTLAALGYYHYRRQEFTEARDRFDAVLAHTRASPETPGSDTERELHDYALRGRQLIDELRKLEVWRADLAGDDAPRVDGWEEVERFGVEISRRGGALMLAGVQRGDPQGVTMARLERSVDSRTFERVLARARIHDGRVRFALRLEGESKRGAATGLLLYRDYDGKLGVMVKGTRAGWEEVPPSPAGEVGRSSRRSVELFFPGTVRWPEDGLHHTLEIRAAEASSSSTSAGFDLFLDGRPVALNVSVPGLSGRTLRVGVSTQTDREGNSYTVSVDQLHLYRRARR